MRRRKWWDVPGVPKPIYIAEHARGKRENIANAILALVLIILLILSAIGIYKEIAIAIGALLALIQGSAYILRSLSGSPTEIEYKFASSLLKELDGRISVWSIPGGNIIFAARMDNGAYMYFIMTRPRRPRLLIGRPRLYLRLVSRRGAKILSIKKVKGVKDIVDIDVILPLPENPRLWYRMVFRGFIIEQRVADVKNIISLVNRV